MSRSAARPMPLVVNSLDEAVDKSTRSPLTAYPASAIIKVRFTLDQAWRDADQQFQKETGRRLLTSAFGQKKSALEVWKQKYECDDSDETHRQYNEMLNLLQTILDGVEVVGAFAAQAASMVFAPAGMCFNALAFLIDAPRQIKKVYDTLKALFEEVGDFLVKFKILKRIDDSTGLDEDLVVNTNKLLISFVRICGLSIRLLEGSKLIVAAKVVFLRDDSGVSAELENFRRLAQSQSMLTGAVTLGRVLKSEEGIKEILAAAGETTMLVRSLAAASNDEKTKLVNKQRLNNIEDNLFVKKDLLAGNPNNPLQFEDDSLIGTLEALEETTLYKEWLHPQQPGRTALFLHGGSGTGKTRMVEALRGKLDSKRQELGREDPSV